MENEKYSQFEDYRDFNEDEKENHANDKLSKLTIPTKLKNLDLNKFGKYFACTSLYPSALYDEKSKYPKL